MRLSILVFVSALGVQLSPSAGYADELWKYYFIANGWRPYYQVCYGDCAASGIRADLAGTFSVLLNWQNSTGRLLSLDDRLVNVASVRSGLSGETLTPSVPSFFEHGIYTPYESPEFGEAAITGTWNNWQLTSDGRIPVPGGGFRTGSPYSITFGLNDATLSLTVPSQWYDGPGVIVTGAQSVLYSAVIAGDFNDDKRVNARDYVTWRKSAGSQADYNLWRSNFGAGTSSAGQTIPEPSSASLFMIGGIAILLPMRRRRSTG
jgi:hypothetical protein